MIFITWKLGQYNIETATIGKFFFGNVAWAMTRDETKFMEEAVIIFGGRTWKKRHPDRETAKKWFEDTLTTILQDLHFQAFP